MGGVLRRFAGDDVPAALTKLATRERSRAIRELAVIGPPAHRFLFGHVRSRPIASTTDLSAAFGDLGPGAVWMRPGLLELAIASGWPDAHGRHATAIALLERLARIVNESATTDVASTPAAAAPIDRRWREPPLAVLADPARQRDWWPAVQALLALDDDAVLGAAAATLFVHSQTGNATSRRARELLLALECHFAAVAVLDMALVLQLPEAARLRELRRCVLANAQDIPTSTSDPERDLRLLRELGIDERVDVRHLAAIRIALRSPSGELAVEQDEDIVDKLAADPDPGTRRLAELVRDAADRTVDAMLRGPLAGEGGRRSGLDAIARLSGRRLAKLSPARVGEILDLCSPRTIPVAGNDLGAEVLRAAQRNDVPRGPASDAWQVVRRLAQECPATLLSIGVPTAGQRETLVRAAKERNAHPALQLWALDAVPANTDVGSGPLPLSMLPVLLARLRAREDMPRTLELLLSQRVWWDWMSAYERDLEPFVAVIAQVPASRRKEFVTVFQHGPNGRRALERLLVDPKVPEELRPDLRLAYGAGLDRHPPNAAFVLAALASADEELRKTAMWAAGHVRDEKETVAKRLLASLPAADPKTETGVVMSLGRLGHPAAIPMLREQTRQPFGAPPLRAAIALVEIDPADEVGIAFLRRALDGDDAESIRLAWHFLSFSPRAAALFLDEAVRVLGDSGDGQKHFRLLRFLKSVATVERERALTVMTALTRHPSSDLAEMASQELKALREEPEHPGR